MIYTLTANPAIDYNIACYDLSTHDSGERILFTVKDSCRSFVYHHLFRYGRTFYNTAVRCQISF